MKKFLILLVMCLTLANAEIDFSELRKHYSDEEILNSIKNKSKEFGYDFNGAINAGFGATEIIDALDLIQKQRKQNQQIEQNDDDYESNYSDPEIIKLFEDIKTNPEKQDFNQTSIYRQNDKTQNSIKSLEYLKDKYPITHENENAISISMVIIYLIAILIIVISLGDFICRYCDNSYSKFITKIKKQIRFIVDFFEILWMVLKTIGTPIARFIGIIISIIITILILKLIWKFILVPSWDFIVSVWNII
ncbi:TPA: hypothetical protein R2L51_000232 [Campylobacter jejuni]|nr:hypothetical protein [Campylobacter jejuni]